VFIRWNIYLAKRLQLTDGRAGHFASVNVPCCTVPSEGYFYVTQERSVTMGGFIWYPTKFNSVMLRGFVGSVQRLRELKGWRGSFRGKSLFKLKSLHIANRNSLAISLVFLSFSFLVCRESGQEIRGKGKRDDTNEKQKTVIICPLLQFYQMLKWNSLFNAFVFLGDCTELEWRQTSVNV
jgi:hypothetical protein